MFHEKIMGGNVAGTSWKHDENMCFLSTPDETSHHGLLIRGVFHGIPPIVII